MRYLKEKETGDMILIDDSSEKGKQDIKNAIASGKYSEWFIYGGCF